MPQTGFTQPGFLVHLFEGGTGRLFTNEAVPVDSIYGTAQYPFIWAVPKILDPNSTFTAEVTIPGALVSATPRLSHTGYKVFGNFNLWKWEKQLTESIQGIPQR